MEKENAVVATKNDKLSLFTEGGLKGMWQLAQAFA